MAVNEMLFLPFCPGLSLLRTLFLHLFADLHESNAVQCLMCNSTIPTAAFSQLCHLALSILQWNETKNKRKHSQIEQVRNWN